VFKWTVGLAACLACSASFADAQPPGYFPPAGYNPPLGVIQPGLGPASPPAVTIVYPSYQSPYNPRIDSPPFGETGDPDFPPLAQVPALPDVVDDKDLPDPPRIHFFDDPDTDKR
jgi:hypothetical protein